MIQIQNLTFAYAEGESPLFSNLNLELSSGGKLALTGKSGIGKTTLIQILAGLLPFKEGTVTLGDFTVSKTKDKLNSVFRNRFLGVIFQDYNLLKNLTVEENLKLRCAIAGLKRDRNYFVSKLSQVGMADFLKKKVGRLSGGQQQRIALVRAIITEPKIVFADEPTGNLDDESAAYISNVLYENSDITVLAASHDPRLIQKMETVLSFNEICENTNETVH